MKSLVPFPKWTLARAAILAAAAIAVSGCGTQIRTLRAGAELISNGVLGAPPALTSLAVTDASPTRNAPLSLNWGLVVGGATGYCLLENDVDPLHCVWHSGALPPTYLDSAADGALSLTAFLRNDFGVSAPVSAPSVTIDRTAPTLASVAIGNSSPTNDPVYALTFGAVTNGTYSEYCIQSNNTSVAACSWTNGSLPASFTVAGAGSKTLSVWLKDAAGNVSAPVQTAAVVYDDTVPTVAITSPAAGAYVNAANVGAVTVSGTCSVDGATVVLSGAATGSPVCTSGAWTATLDFTAAAAGSVALHADLTNPAGTAAVQDSRNFTKDVVAPTISSVSAPGNGTHIVGDSLSFSVVFTDAVTVTGTPRIPITIGSTAYYANYASGGGTTTLVFTYTVASGDYDNDGIAATSPIALNSGTIADAAGNAATLTFTVPTLTSVLVDAVLAAITGVTAPANDCYSTGANVDFTATFSKPVDVTGSPRIPITLESGTVYATYLSGTGTSSLVFRYTLGSGDESFAIPTLPSAISLNSGTIKDALTQDANLAFTAPSFSWAVNGYELNGQVLRLLPANDASGKIYVGGDFTEFCYRSATGLVRLTSDLKRDATFDLGTGFTGSFGGGHLTAANPAVYALAYVPDGSGDLYVGGTFKKFRGATQGGMIRLNADGTKDATFNVTTGFDNIVYVIHPMADGTGRMWVGGNFYTFAGSATAKYARLNPNGTLEAGSAGVLGFSTGCNVYTFITLADGKENVIMGVSSSCGAANLNRLLGTTAAPDATFPSDAGTQWDSFTLLLDTTRPDRTDTDGRFFSSGNGVYVNTGHEGAFTSTAAFARFGRFDQSGNLDSTFNTKNGSAYGLSASSGTYDAFVLDAILSPTGDGSAWAVGNFDRFKGAATAANLIHMSGTDAKLTGTFDPTTGFDDWVNAVAYAGDGSGKIVVGGRFSTFNGAKTPHLAVVDTIAGTQPIVTSVSSGTANGTYGPGNPVTVTVRFTEAVTVSTAGGTPYVILRTGNTWPGRATYASGSGTDTLTFSYTTVAGDTSAHLDVMNETALVLNGGTITGGTSGNAANVAFPTTGSAASFGAQTAIVLTP